MSAMSKKNSTTRLDPKKVGTVVRVPLEEGVYAYLCNNFGNKGYKLYGFVSDNPVAAPKFFNPEEWIASVQWRNLPATCRDVAVIRLTDEQNKAVSYYKRLDYVDPDFGTSIRIRDKDTRIHRAGTEEEIVGMPLDIWYYGEDIIPWILEHRSQMRLIRVEEADVDRKTDLIPVEKKEGVRDGRETVIEIQVPEASPELFAQREDLEEELIGELMVAGCAGEQDVETGHGSMGDFAFDIAVTVDTKRFKTALGIVRRVLKKYKVPESVWIQEFRDDLEAAIEHPLIAPPKK
jgi:hypothetical protein